MLVNGAIDLNETQLDPNTRLIEVLRTQLGLTGTKISCSTGECGSCTVLVNGRPVLACITLASRVSGSVETVEGVADEATSLREAFARRSAFQCGFCTPGQIVRAVALLRQGLPSEESDLRQAISGNICRCTGYQGIVDAIRDAADQGGVDDESEAPYHRDRWKDRQP